MRWSEEEKNYIQENAGRLTDKELAKGLKELTGFTISAGGVKKARQSLGIKGRGPGQPKRWTDLVQPSQSNGPVKITFEGDPLLLNQLWERFVNSVKNAASPHE